MLLAAGVILAICRRRRQRSDPYKTPTWGGADYEAPAAAGVDSPRTLKSVIGALPHVVPARPCGRGAQRAPRPTAGGGLRGEMTRRAALAVEAEQDARVLAVADAVSTVLLRAGNAARLAGLPFGMARACLRASPR